MLSASQRSEVSSGHPIYPWIANLFLSVDFLYGEPGGKELSTVFDDLKRYDALIKLDEEAWTTILKRYDRSPSPSQHSHC